MLANRSRAGGGPPSRGPPRGNDVQLVVLAAGRRYLPLSTSAGLQVLCPLEAIMPVLSDDKVFQALLTTKPTRDCFFEAAYEWRRRREGPKRQPGGRRRRNTPSCSCAARATNKTTGAARIGTCALASRTMLVAGPWKPAAPSLSHRCFPSQRITRCRRGMIQCVLVIRESFKREYGSRVFHFSPYRPLSCIY